MTDPADEKKEPPSAQVTVEENRSIFVVDGLKFEINRGGDVTIYKTDGVKMRPGIAGAVATKDSDTFEVSKSFNKVSAYGATVEFSDSGSVVVHTNGEVRIEPPAAGGDSAPGGRRERFPRPGR